MFYGWEPLRDICNPGSLRFAVYTNAYMQESGDTVLTDECERIIDQHKPDLAFLYMVETDEKGGHDNGWMTEAYLARISTAIDNVKRMFDKYGDEYRIIIMADHGGHERSHGTDLPEDMTIPLFFIGERFENGATKDGLSLLDIAPTVAAVMGIPADPDWEGKSIV